MQHIDEGQVLRNEDHGEEQQQNKPMAPCGSRWQLIVPLLSDQEQRKQVGCPCQLQGEQLKYSKYLLYNFNNCINKYYHVAIKSGLFVEVRQ